MLMPAARVFFALAAAALLAGCGPKVVCSYDGHIIVPDSASAAQRTQWALENDYLDARRSDVLRGDRALTSTYTQRMLDQADSCP